jgi:hypothetical protein
MTKDAAYDEIMQWLRQYGRSAALRWHRGTGYARYGGVAAWWDGDPPAIAPDAQDIEYAGGVVMTIDGQPMTDAQQVSTQRLLVQMAQDARDALTGQSTLVVVCDRQAK